MSCYGCTKKYGIFCKEHGCPNCGYSYCAKCLKREAAVPRHGGKIMNICLICFDKLSKLQTNEKVIDCDSLPGTIVAKGFASAGQQSTKTTIDEINSLFNDIPPFPLDNVLAPISTATPSANVKESKTNNAEIDENLDIVISKRLKNLKKVENLANDDELHARLSDLSGMPNKEYSKKDLLLTTDKKTDQEQMDDLLKQFKEETTIDKRIESEREDQLSDIESRLRALRETPIDYTSNVHSKQNNTVSPDLNTSSDNEEDEQTVLKKIMEKYLAEAHLPNTKEDIEKYGTPSKVPQKDQEELPWCTICNEDAVVRCLSCDGDLFCGECFRTFHNDDEEYRNHIKEKFNAPPKFQENHF